MPIYNAWKMGLLIKISQNTIISFFVFLCPIIYFRCRDYRWKKPSSDWKLWRWPIVWFWFLSRAIFQQQSLNSLIEWTTFEYLFFRLKHSFSLFTYTFLLHYNCVFLSLSSFLFISFCSWKIHIIVAAVSYI